MPVGSVHQPESKDSSRVRCRQTSRGVREDTTCLLLPSVDFCAVCTFATRDVCGLKNSPIKNIPYSSSFQSTRTTHEPRFWQHLSRFVLRAQSRAAPVFRGIQMSSSEVGVVVTGTTKPPGSHGSGRFVTFLA